MADIDEKMIDYSSDDEKAQKPTKNKQPVKKGQKAKAQPKKGTNLHASSFEDFHLRQELMRAITEVGFEHPSEGKSISTKRRDPCYYTRRGSPLSG